MHDAPAEVTRSGGPDYRSEIEAEFGEFGRICVRIPADVVAFVTAPKILIDSTATEPYL